MGTAKVMKHQSLEAQYRQLFAAKGDKNSSARGDSLEQPFAGEVVDSVTTTYSVREKLQTTRMTELVADAELE